MVYLMMDEKRNSCYYKVGFTKNLDKRLVPYSTHNPNAILTSTVITYKKTLHELETAIHEELEKMNVKFIISENTGIKTEWFSVEYDSEIDIGLRQNGLGYFKSCKGRKVMMVVK